MDDVIVNVNASDYVLTNVINNIKIKVNKLVLFKSVSLCVNLLNDNKLIDNKFFELTGTEYTNWMNDDTYIVTYVLTQLNLTQTPKVTTS
jgi:hypothetical protein